MLDAVRNCDWVLIAVKRPFAAGAREGVGDSGWRSGAGPRSPLFVAASFSLAAILNCGLKLAPIALLLNRSFGSTFLPSTSFFTLLLDPLPRVGLGPPPVKNDSGPSMVFVVLDFARFNAPGLLLENSKLLELAPFDGDTDPPKPRSLEAAGAHPPL